MAKLKYQLTSPILMWLIVALGGIILSKIVPHGWLFASSGWGKLIFFLGLADWFYVLQAALRRHRQAGQSAQAIDRLITEGAYAVVRHPIYLADIILALCVFIWQPSYSVLAIVVWLAVVLIFWANLEERMLEEKFLADYTAYKQEVPMFLPRLFKKIKKLG